MSKLIVVELKLVRPYNQSLETLYKMINLWNMNLLQSGTESAKAVIEIPEDKWEKLYGEEPSVGNWEPPDGTLGFIEKLTVTKIKKVKAKKNGKNSRTR
jgi:hypothetical protein